MSIEQNIETIRKKIRAASQSTHASGSEIIIVCVTKHRTCDEIFQALDAGITHLGENRLQEAEEKIDALRGYLRQNNIQGRIHMIGHLQTNKAAKAVRLFDMIQSVDSLKLCQKINDCSLADNRLSEVLVEVNVSGEASKFGVSVDELISFLKKANEFNSIFVRGLMTMAPLNEEPQAARPYFRALRQVRDQVNAIKKEGALSRISMDFLSMGMSQDFEVAVEEGANMVRIGTAIFEGAQ